MENLASRLDACGAAVHIDITPLLDSNWTGIPVVAAQLSRQFLRAAPEQTAFFFEHALIDKGAVLEALERNSGHFLHRDVFHGKANLGALDVAGPRRRSVGFFPSVKRVRRVFDREFSVMHDLSTLVTPQFHQKANIAYHMDTLRPDLESNDVTFCVSEATLLDVHAYMGTPMERLALMHNGAEWPEDFAVRFENEVDEALVEPFVVILGTREPRKNIQRVFEMLSLFPELMERRRFVFVGKMGWLGEQTAVPEALRPALAAGRIHFTGFVSDYEKYKLLRAAEVSIYPSFFEGFGLPVLESIAVGTPCLSSWSSSLPEVGGEACLYFDPMSVMDMYRALNQFHGMTPAARARLTQRCLAAGAFLTWENAFDVVARRMMPHLETL